MNDDTYDEASPEQKLSIATYFIMSSPIGEVDFVVADTKKLVDDDSLLDSAALAKILKDYNMEQMTAVINPFGEKKQSTIISSYGMVSESEFVDPNSRSVLVFDHLKRTFTGKSDKKQDIDDEFEKQRVEIQKKVDEYVEKLYKPGKCVGIVYGSEAGDMTVCLTASNTKISSYWTGGWNATFNFSVSENKEVEMVGNIKVHVHYFEDGNVQLHATIEKIIKVTVSSAPEKTAESVCKGIKKIESDYQSHLEDMYVAMHSTTFKSMRRFLPVSRQPMEWNIAAHGVGMMNK